jgi:erythromycin esterase-like protein
MTTRDARRVPTPSRADRNGGFELTKVAAPRHVRCYFEVRLADQLDAVIHVDRTRALEPLERTARWERGELPETYPTGL